MADLTIAYELTNREEGFKGWRSNAGYALDPDDPGGETFNGLSRVYNGDLRTWDVVDENKKKYGRFQAIHLTEEQVQILKTDHLQFCRFRIWNPVRGDEYPNQSLANQVYDFAFHKNPWLANAYMQRALNKVNRVGTLYPNMTEDGFAGRITLRALNLAIHHGHGSRVHVLFKSYRVTWYSERMEASEKKERYLGWIDRADRFHYEEK